MTEEERRRLVEEVVKVDLFVRFLEAWDSTEVLYTHRGLQYYTVELFKFGGEDVESSGA